jgi:hypothetical protein
MNTLFEAPYEATSRGERIEAFDTKTVTIKGGPSV